jgi:hypothetical protein
MSRFVMLTFNSFLTHASQKKISIISIDNKTISSLLGIFQDCMIMVAIIMFSMALILLIGS